MSKRKTKREIEADAILQAAHLPPYGSGRFIQVEDIKRLANEVRAKKEKVCK